MHVTPEEVNILGERWEILFGTAETYPDLKVADGYCDYSVRKIFIKMWPEDAIPGACENLREYEKLMLRHEIIHAFFYESGLAHNSVPSEAWAMNEEMVDWFARMHKKLHKAFTEAGAYAESEDPDKAVIRRGRYAVCPHCGASLPPGGGFVKIWPTRCSYCDRRIKCICEE